LKNGRHAAGESGWNELRREHGKKECGLSKRSGCLSTLLFVLTCQISDKAQYCGMPSAKPVKLPRRIKFDDAMRRAMRIPPPPMGKKAQKRVWRKKSRKG
jgi:hypothetical protein